MNVILITIDSLRADHLSCYGYDKETAPFLCKLSQDTVFFTDAYSVGPLTRCSIPCILTGTYSSRFPDNIIKINYLSEKRKTLAEIFKEAGYKTAGFHNNPHLASEFNYNRGFDNFEDFEAYFYPILKLPREKGPHFIIKNIRLLFERVFYRMSYLPAKEINREVLRFLKTYKDNRLFLWIHYMDVHHPYLDHKKWKGNRYARKLYKKMLERPDSLSKDEINALIALYDGEISYIDFYIEELISRLKTAGLYENSLIVITSDHGDEFLDHGGFSHPPKLYEELIRVPLIIRFPHDKYKRRIIREPVSLLDLAPTMMDAAGIDINHDLHGESLIPIVENGMRYKERAIISEYGIHLFSIRKGFYKLIYDDRTKLRELYNLKIDPKEAHNLAAKEVTILTELEKLLSDHISKIPRGQNGEEEKMYDENIKRRLRALGYVD